MRNCSARFFASAVLAALILVGCLPGERELKYLGDPEVSYYKDAATDIDYPNVSEPQPEQVAVTEEPRTIRNRRKDEIWDMHLAEAVQIALTNSEVIRIAGNQENLSSLLSNPQRVNSIYDPAIQETGFLFGGRGVEAALADFDAQFTTSMVWGRNETVPNSQFFGPGGSPGGTLTQETGQFNSQLQKNFAYGGQFALSHFWNYEGSNAQARLFPSAYEGSVRADYRHPLWAGSGAEFTRIAGPITQTFTGITGVNQGVVIARINNDITIADFEASVRNLVSDVERLYWRLYLQYRIYDSQVVARNSALRSWREAKAKLDVGGVRNFKPADEAQALDRYFETESAVEEALSQIYTTEIRLRRLMGLPVNDGKVIRPADEPTAAEFVPDWYASLTTALTERVELRRQKWNIKSLELQHRAAQSLTNPRLDFVSGYQVNGFGDNLFGESDDDVAGTAQGFDSAYETITQGNQTGWDLGFEFTMPVGFRQAHAQVQNLELRLAKARAVLAAQELDISHELALALQELAQNYETAQTNFNRLRAAQRQVRLFEAEVEAGTTTLDLLLRAQASLANARIAYYQSLVDYNLAITNFHFRTGVLLEHNGVHTLEGEWTPEAQEDALRRAWSRSFALDNKYLHTEPEEFELDQEGQPFLPEGNEFLDDTVAPAPHPLHGTPNYGVPGPVPEGEMAPPPSPLGPAPLDPDAPIAPENEEPVSPEPEGPVPTEPSGPVTQGGPLTPKEPVLFESEGSQPLNSSEPFNDPAAFPDTDSSGAE